MVRMDFTLESFFSDGGTTNFIDRLSSSLGIHASDVKIVSVYEGSLVVNYELTTSDDDPDTLVALEASQNTLLSSSDVDLGAPVMEHASSVVVDQERTFTEAEHEVYEIQTDGSASDLAWENSYITFDYEPIVVINDDTQLPSIDDSEDNIIQQELEVQEEIYNNDMIQYGFADA